MTQLMINVTTALVDSIPAPPQPEEAVGEDVYVVMMVTLIIWLGLFAYLYYLDGRVRSLKKDVESLS